MTFIKKVKRLFKKELELEISSHKDINICNYCSHILAYVCYSSFKQNTLLDTLEELRSSSNFICNQNKDCLFELYHYTFPIRTNLITDSFFTKKDDQYFIILQNSKKSHNLPRDILEHSIDYQLNFYKFIIKITINL